MQHKLKKDLPFAKAGERVNVEDSGGDALEIEVSGYKCYIPRNVFDEWIAEIKPREWYEIMPKGKYGNKCKRFNSLQEAESELEKDINKNWFEIIKVREVSK